MHYDIRSKGGGSHWVRTNDGVVREASEALRWSIGKKVSAVMNWSYLKKFKVYVTPEGGQTRKIEMESA